MNLKQYYGKAIIIVACMMASLLSYAQEKKVAPTSKALYNEIAHMDSVMFAAFNRQDMKTFKPLFTEDLEWFQDDGGLIPYDTVFKNFETIFSNEAKLNRQWGKGSLEVHPIKNYGAIEIGTHQSRHMESGKEETGTFRFL